MKLIHFMLGFAIIGGAVSVSGCVTGATQEDEGAAAADDPVGATYDRDGTCTGQLRQNPDGTWTCLGYARVETRPPPVCTAPQG